MMTLKEFFIAALAQFEADVSTRAESVTGEYLWHCAGMCDALSETAAKNSLYGSDLYKEACWELRKYKPVDCGAYWFPIDLGDFTQDECVLPRRAILQAIIDSL